jgi:hypothetical protein
MKKSLLSCTATIILTLVLAGCGTPPASPSATQTEAVATPTASEPPSLSGTPDPCESPQIEEIAQNVQKHMREFDDASTLASSVPQAQLGDSIADLQRIRREADDEEVPACLTDLKTYQINHMNAVIGTLLAFMRAGDPTSIDCADIVSNSEEDVVCQNIAFARQQHDQYLVELARVLEIPVVTATPGTLGAPPETAAP